MQRLAIDDLVMLGFFDNIVVPEDDVYKPEHWNKETEAESDFVRRILVLYI